MDFIVNNEMTETVDMIELSPQSNAPSILSQVNSNESSDHDLESASASLNQQSSSINQQSSFSIGVEPNSNTHLQEYEADQSDNCETSDPLIPQFQIQRFQTVKFLYIFFVYNFYIITDLC